MQLQNFFKAAARYTVAGLLLGYSVLSHASEASLVHGLYRKSKVEDGLSKSEITLGARYAQQFSQSMFWFAQGGLSIKSYSSGGDITPDSTNDISTFGGIRMYFDRINETFTPYGMVSGGFQTISDASQPVANTINETKESGLYYGAAIGLRMNLSKAFFLDLEAPLFNSALSAERKTTNTTQVGSAKTETTSKTTRQELYLDSSGAFGDLILSFGMRI